jgi:hypothetical protein
MQSEVFKVTGNVLSMHINSEIDESKFRAICKEIEQAAAVSGKVRLVLVMRHYPSFNSAEDLYEDLRFIKLNAHRIEKAAILCDKTWKRTWIGIFGLFSGVKIGFFDISEVDAAAKWIQA